jgi:hypothetical protein
MSKNYNSLRGNKLLPLLDSMESERCIENQVFNSPFFKLSKAMKTNWLFGLLMLFTLFTSTVSSAQVATNSGSGLNPTYPDLASAITALNGAVISDPVVITLTGNETAPVGGYAITAQGTAVNTIVIEGNASTITAPTPQASGVLTDAVFKLVGADWVTLQGFTMLENVANTTTVGASNNMTEWGVAILYATAANGAQNNTIQNNTIDLNRTYQNTFGVYSNSTHTATSATVSVTATGATGGNHGLKIYGNAITDVNIGILVVGPTAAADQNDGIDIGGAALATGNTITNYGTTGTFSAYANVSGSVYGILVRNTKNYNVSYNTVTSSNGGVTSGTLRGIYVPAFSNAPTGIIVNAINNNTVSVRSGVIASPIIGIQHEATTVNVTTTLNIDNNDFNTSGPTVAGTATVTFIQNVSTAGILSISNNKFTNLSVNTTGTCYLINNNNSTNNFTVNNNAVVGSFSKTGAGGTMYGYYNFGSPSGGTGIVSNNDFSNIFVVGASIFYGIRQYTTTTQIENVSNNTVSNIFGGTGAVYGISHGYGAAGSIVNGNTVASINGASSIIGINLGDGSAGTVDCYNNVINGLITTGASAVSGISNSLGTTNNIFKNKIYNLEANNASGSVNGILVASGTTVSLYNNIIGDLKTPSSNAANPLVGINVTGGTTVNVNYNTVYVNGISSGALFGSSAVSVSTTPTVTLRNNIFVNNSSVMGAGLAVAYRRSSATLTSYGATSNNNLFYAGNIYTDGTNTDATLSAFKTRVASRDGSSISENPTFTSITGSNVDFLHVDTTIATQIESGAAQIAGVTDDFDGNVRNVTTPDIGADEFTGVPADLTGPTIVHTQVGATCSGGSRTISATITDGSGVPVVGAGLPVAYWKINAGVYNVSVGTNMGAGVYDFTIGTGSVSGDVISYYFVAQDNAATPNLSVFPSLGAAGFTSNPPAVTTPPTTPFSYSIVSPMNGVYTVGAAGTYTTLTAAVADYNLRCLTGPVTLSLLDATYPSETFPIVIQQNADASSVNTLTIKPDTGIAATITGSNAVAIIKLNGADYVTVDGSNNGTTSRDLTIENTNAAGAVAWVSSLNVSNGALNTTFKNIKFIGNAPTTTTAGIVASGSTLGAAAESPNHNITIVNNAFSKMQNGVFAIGNAVTTDQAWTVADNVIGSAVAGEKIGFRGIAIQNAQGFIISGNQINGVLTASTSTASGIIVGGVATNGSVYNNKVSDIKNTNTGGYGSNGIYLNSTNTAANILVYNNFVSDVVSHGYATGAGVADNGYGIIVNQGAGYSIYNNTVAMNTNQNVAGKPAALNVTVAVTTAGAINLRNNIFSNAQTQTGERYAIYSEAANTVFASIDYNDYFTTGANLGFIGSDRADLVAVQAGFGGNTNSKNVAPVFTSVTDLHLVPASNVYLDNLGTPIAAVTVDIDGDTRNATTPDMGADEFTSPVCTAAVGGTTSASAPSICISGSSMIVATGYSSGDTTSYQWQSSVDAVFTTPVNIGTASTTYADLDTGVITATTYYRLAVTCVANGLANNSTVTTVTVNNTAVPTGAATQTFCNTATVADLSATGTGTIQWYAAATGGTALVSTTALADATHYFASQTISGCESATRLDATASVNVTPVPAGSATQTFCNAATVADLSATGTGTIQWYTAATGGTALVSTTALVDATHYFASQTVSGCESATRLDVTVTVNNTPAPTGAATQTFVTGQTLADIVVIGSNVIWYASLPDATTGTNPLSNTTVLVDATTYYATQTVSGCVSATSLVVTITVTLGVDSFDSNSFSFYPNPVNEILNLSYSQEMTNVRVFNVIGQEVLVKNINATTAQVDMTGLANGAYFVKVSTDKATKTIKVIKK